MGSKHASDSYYCGSAVTFTAWKVSKYGDFSDPYFPAFGLNAEGVSPSIQSECRKIRTRKTLYLDTFHEMVLRFNTLGQNICRLFQVLTQFPVTIIETELDYYQQKVNVHILSKAVKQH